MHFDPKTVALLRATLDRAWAGLPLSEQAKTSRSVLAERILVAAAKGERDPERLRASSMLGVPAVKGRFELPGVIAERSTPDEPTASAPVDTKLRQGANNSCR